MGKPQARFSIPQRTTSPLTHRAGPWPPPPPAPVCRSRLPAPPAHRAAIDARSRLTCSRRAEGAPTMGCLCALAGAEPAAPRLKYKQPRRHLPPRPRSPGGKSAGIRPQRRGTPQPRRTREWDAAPRRPGRFLPSPPAHPRGAAGCRLHGWGCCSGCPPCQRSCPSFGATKRVMLPSPSGLTFVWGLCITAQQTCPRVTTEFPQPPRFVPIPRDSDTPHPSLAVRGCRGTAAGREMQQLGWGCSQEPPRDAGPAQLLSKHW